VSNHVPSLLLTPLDLLVPSNDRDTHYTGRPVRAQTRSAPARIGMDAPGDVPERVSTRTLPVDSDHLLPPPLSF
jgi:hypothetical protein